MHLLLRSFAIFVLVAIYGNADDIDFEVRNGYMLKMLREMANKTNASDSLNLPANATSIRENITDTFSCENRTYGYYADVDNDCQLFHVCLPSQTPSGRNFTYRWSFICPSETVFNQEYLTCTRPRDSIPCEDSPDFYDLNNEIGKVPPKNDSKKIDKDTRHKPQYERERYQYNDRYDEDQILRDRQNIRNTINNRKQDKRKQNIILDKLLTHIVDDEMKENVQNMGGENFEVIFPEMITSDVSQNEPQNINNKEDITMVDDVDGRLALERSVGARRSFRFKADI